MDGFPHFRIVIAYDQCAAGKRALSLSERMGVQLQPRLRISSDAWKFEMIIHPSLRELAADAAGNADMLIIAMDSVYELPTAVKAWIEEWAGRERNKPVALVALHNLGEEPQNDSSSLRSYLYGIAQRADVAFFWRGENGPIENLEQLMSCGIRTLQPVGEA